MKRIAFTLLLLVSIGQAQQPLQWQFIRESGKFRFSFWTLPKTSYGVVRYDLSTSNYCTITNFMATKSAMAVMDLDPLAPSEENEPPCSGTVLFYLVEQKMGQ